MATMMVRTDGYPGNVGSGAWETARGIEDSGLRVAKLVDIAGAEAGHLAGAIATAREIEDAFHRARALAEIALAQSVTMRDER